MTGGTDRAGTAKRRAPRQSLPEWMRPYLVHIVNTGGNDIEEMFNGDADPRTNLPLSTLQACVKSQVVLLQRLHDSALLRPPT